MATVVRRGKPREVIVRKVQFLGKFLSPVLDEVTMLRLRSHLRLSKGFRTKLRLTTHGISCGVKSRSFIRGKLPYDFTPLDDVHNMYIDQVHPSVLLCVSPYPGGQLEVVAYKFGDDVDAKLFHQLFCELAKKATDSNALPMVSRSGYVEFDKQDDLPVGSEAADANWLFSPGGAKEQVTSNGWLTEKPQGISMTGQVQQQRKPDLKQSKTLQEVVETRAAQTYETQAAIAKERQVHVPSTDTMRRDVEEISRELQNIRSLLVRGDEASLAEARRRIYQASAPFANHDRDDDVRDGGRPSKRASREAVSVSVADHRLQPAHQAPVVNRRTYIASSEKNATWNGPQRSGNATSYTGNGRVASNHDYRMSRGVARNLQTVQVRSRSSDSHLRYVPSQDSLGSERMTVATSYMPASSQGTPAAVYDTRYYPRGEDHYVVYPSGQRRSLSATRYEVRYR